MKSFIYSPLPGRVVFGAGRLRDVAKEAAALGIRRALILCTPEQRSLTDQVVSLLADSSAVAVAGIFDKAVMHVPIETVREARALAQECGADGAISLGGGSTTGLGKAIALASGLPILAIPTTYAGSEMTPIYGVTEAGLKKTGRDPKVLPRTVIYDPELTLSLPAGLSITSGINAIAHAVEGLYAPDANPVNSLMAEEGIAALAKALPVLRKNVKDLEARSQALYGAWLCGSVLGHVGMGLHHKLCHTLGGTFNLPHAETHTIVLPHAVAYNQAFAPEAMARVARALGHAKTPNSMNAASAAQGLFDLAADNGAPTSLQSLGLTQADLAHALDLALQNQYPNPRPLERESLQALLQDAFEGRRPTV
jgi:alcohol dehydrogenase class IV